MKNNYRIEGETAIVEVVSKGVVYEVLLDVEDIERFGNRTITRFSNGYFRFKYKGKDTLVHRFVVNAPEDKELVVDHINGNKNDNRKSNLRVVTRGMNRVNTEKTTSRTGVKGVYKQPSGKYRATIQVNKKFINLGHYNTIEEASRAYEQAREVFWGEVQSKVH